MDKGYEIAVLPTVDAYATKFDIKYRYHHMIGAMKCNQALFRKYRADHDNKSPVEVASIEHNSCDKTNYYYLPTEHVGAFMLSDREKRGLKKCL